MEKATMSDICNDLKAKRDCLLLHHEELKQNNDKYNKTIIILSLMTGMIESTKIKMGWNGEAVALIPILMSSIIACVSALVKFKKFPEQMEILVQSTSLLTNTLSKCRNHKDVDDEIMKEYNDALEHLEVSMYPDLRKKFLRQSHKNLLCIMKQEQTYFDNIKKVNRGEKISFNCDSDSDSNNPSVDNVSKYNIDLEVGEKIPINDEFDSPLSNRKLPLIKEEADEL
tara:strand:+ start:350 stop:1030 length:681 start_codon:yes stop_codon:yes gene_type:complete